MSLADKLLYFCMGMVFTLQVLVIILQVKEIINDNRKLKAWKAEMDIREKELAAKWRKIRSEE